MTQTNGTTTAKGDGAELDHLVLGCLALAQAGPKLEAAFGVPAQGGGKHDGRGTHNLLWRLDGGARGPAYLELIAPDPDQTPPDGPMPFALHLEETRARLAAGPSLLAWVARSDRAETLAAASPADHGPMRELSRDGLTWRLSLPEDGVPPCGGAAPLLIDWPGGAAGSPALTLPESGLTLTAFVRRPDPEAAAALESLGLADVLPEGETGGGVLAAEIEGPGGRTALR